MPVKGWGFIIIVAHAQRFRSYVEPSLSVTMLRVDSEAKARRSRAL
jgi:hypothetical protein